MFSIKVSTEIEKLYRKPCCRKRVGNEKSFSLGFGKKKYHGSDKLIDDFYGEWEIGSYTANWKIFINDQLACDSFNEESSIADLDKMVQEISFGNILKIKQVDVKTVKVVFENDIAVYFIELPDEDDETFHIFCPDSIYIEFSSKKGWVIGNSDEPW